jgi:transposase-like protein
MKTPLEQIDSAIKMFFKGIPIRNIRKFIEEKYNNDLTDATFYNWIYRFTGEGLDQFKEYRPKVGDIWIAPETSIEIGRKKYWIMDLIDSKTHFFWRLNYPGTAA